jgi:hypothetical protein
MNHPCLFRIPIARRWRLVFPNGVVLNPYLTTSMSVMDRTGKKLSKTPELFRRTCSISTALHVSPAWSFCRPEYRQPVKMLLNLNWKKGGLRYGPCFRMSDHLSSLKILSKTESFRRSVGSLFDLFLSMSFRRLGSGLKLKAF